MFTEYIWFIVFILALLLEGCTVQLVSIWFCVGAVFAEIAALFNCPLPIQVALFTAVSVLCLIFLYPMIIKNLKNKKQNLNADKVIGLKGVVIETIDNLKAEGQVKVDGKVWTCRSDTDEIIEKDSIVEVLKIDGVKLIIKKTQ